MTSAEAGVSYLAVAPEIVLMAGVVAVLMVAVYRDPPVRVLGSVAGGTILLAAVAAVFQWNEVSTAGGGIFFGQTIALDAFAVFGRFVLLGSAALGLAAGWAMIAGSGRRSAEAIALVLLATIGFSLMAASTNLIMTFLALEIGSISLYILAGFTRTVVAADEAALKYFLLGAFASAIFVYGAALVYAGTGSLSLHEIAGFLTSVTLLRPAVLLIGLALLIAGLAFKISAAPFHAWAPDVYQGAPAGLVGFMAAAAKVGGFAALLRILLIAFPSFITDWAPLLAALSALSLVVGSAMALVQDDFRRLLAYSGVAHAGFILLGVVAGSEGLASVWFYLAVYTVQLIAAFAVVAAVSGPASSGSSLDSYRGLAATNPFMAAVLTVMLLALAGVPVTAGFVAKFGVFVTAWQAGFEWLVFLALLAAVAAFGFYLRVIVLMYMEAPILAEAPGTPPARPQASGPTRWVLIVSTALTIALGIYPAPLLELLRDVLLI